MKHTFNYYDDTNTWDSPDYIQLSPTHQTRAQELAKNIEKPAFFALSTKLIYTPNCTFEFANTPYYIRKNSALARELLIGNFKITIEHPANCTSLQWLQAKHCPQAPHYKYTQHQKSWDAKPWHHNDKTWFLQATIGKDRTIELENLIERLKSDLEEAWSQLYQLSK